MDQTARAKLEQLATALHAVGILGPGPLFPGEEAHVSIGPMPTKDARALHRMIAHFSADWLPRAKEPTYFVYLADPGGERDHLAYFGQNKADAENAMDQAENCGLEPRLEIR